MADAEILPLDTTDESMMWGYHAAAGASVLVERPDIVPTPYVEWAADLRRPPVGDHRFDLVARAADGTILGGTWAWMSTADNLTTAWTGVDVHPDHRRRGVGTALALAVEEAIPPERTSLTAAVRIGAHGPGDGTAAADPTDHGYVRFARALGYRVASLSSLRSLPLPVPTETLERLDSRERAEADGYAIETYIDGVPESYRKSLGVLKGLIDVDAPTGDLDWEPSPTTPSQYAELLRRVVEDGCHQVEAVAVKAGEVVGYSELQTSSVPARHVYQEGTLVAATHRGHRLGMAVKVAAVRAVQELGPWPRISTENDDANRWMIQVNEELGFTVDGREVLVTKDR